MWLLIRLDFRLVLYLLVCCWMGLTADADTAANDADNAAEFNCCGKFDGWNVAVVDDKFFTSANDSSVGVSPCKNAREKEKTEKLVFFVALSIDSVQCRGVRQGQEETFCLRTSVSDFLFIPFDGVNVNDAECVVFARPFTGFTVPRDAVIASTCFVFLLHWIRCVGKRVSGRTHRKKSLDRSVDALKLNTYKRRRTRANALDVICDHK